MSGEPPKELEALGAGVKSSWHRFLDVFEPLRPELYRYCRCLTRSPWDAEDLVQDALMRAFVTLGTVFRDLPNPRAWLFRVASNLWIDRVRRSRFELAVEAPTGPRAEPDPRAPREAAGALLVRLSPQERAAVVLKDVFDFSLEEIAETLSTTPGAVKTALHRGRGKLSEQSEPEEPPARAPAPGVLDAFEHDAGPMVRTVMTLDAEGDRIARACNYFFSPDVIAEICAELGVPFRVNGYRYWHDAGVGGS